MCGLLMAKILIPNLNYLSCVHFQKQSMRWKNVGMLIKRTQYEESNLTHKGYKLVKSWRINSGISEMKYNLQGNLGSN